MSKSNPVVTNMRIETGGAAFPHPDGYLNVNGDLVFHENTGMTLRDYFAAKSLDCAFNMADFSGNVEAKHYAGVAKCAYSIADAMLAERAKAQTAQDGV